MIWIFNLTKKQLHTLEVRNYISKTLLEKHKGVFLKTTQFIPYEKNLILLKTFQLKNYFVKFYLNRIKIKTIQISQHLEKTQYN